MRARNEYLIKVGRKSIHRLLFDHLLPYPRRLHLAARAVAAGKTAGLTDVARALGLLRLFGRNFGTVSDIIDQFPPGPFRDRNRAGNYPGEGSGPAVAYFVGCGVDIVQ